MNELPHLPYLIQTVIGIAPGQRMVVLWIGAQMPATICVNRRAAGVRKQLRLRRPFQAELRFATWNGTVPPPAEARWLD